MHELHPGELADILEDLGKDERTMIVHSLGPEAVADALEEAEEDVQAAVISQLDPEWRPTSSRRWIPARRPTS